MPRCKSCSDGLTFQKGLPVAHRNGEIRSAELTHHREVNSYYFTAVLANPDLIDKLRVAVYPSIPFQAPTVGSPGCVFRFLPEPRSASARDPRSPPSTRRSAALGQATEPDSGGSVTLGLGDARSGTTGSPASLSSKPRPSSAGTGKAFACSGTGRSDTVSRGGLGCQKRCAS
jgi:hypothetical protein